MSHVLNRNFGEIVLEGNELTNMLFEGGNRRELKNNAIKILCTWYAKAIYDDVHNRVPGNDEADIKAKINRVPIMAINDTVNKTRLRTSTQLAGCLEKYVVNLDAGNEPPEFTEESALVLYLDTSVLYHDLDNPFDGLNWSLIYDHFVPKTVVVPAAVGAAVGAAGGAAIGAAGRAAGGAYVDPDVERVARAIEKAAAYTSKSKEDVFNVTNLPKEVMDRFIKNNLPDKITLKRDLAKFKNALTMNGASTLALNFIRFPNNNYASYIIMKMVLLSDI